MRTYGNTYHERCALDDARRSSKAAMIRANEVKALRQLVVDIVAEVNDDPTTTPQELVDMLANSGFDKHLINRCKRKIT